MKRNYLRRIIYILLLTIVTIAMIWLVRANRNPDLDQASVPPADPVAQIANGAYLARVGNCMSCHTARGGNAYAGGRAVPTPFGNVYTSNLTPDAETGIGRWTNDDFWHALHDGKSKNGTLLYPAFPYTNFTRVTRADSDAMFAYLKTVAAISQKNTEPELRFPYNNRFLMYAWRALYFHPGQYVNNDRQSVEWNRGAYLSQGLGHCSACHSPRDELGGTRMKTELGGGVIPVLNWYAPPLNKDAASSLGNRSAEDIAALLQTGVSPHHAVTGPMSEVVGASLQYMTKNDVSAITMYLQSLPQQVATPIVPEETIREEDKKAMRVVGEKLYGDQCASCHQISGAGVSSIYPPLANNHAITTPISNNAIRMVLFGGYAPSTKGNPRPYGMPPFGQSMTDEEVAAVLTYIRNAWGNHGNAVSAIEVNRHRSRQGQ